MSLDHLKEWIDKLKTTTQHTHTQQQGLQASHRFGDIKVSCSTEAATHIATEEAIHRKKVNEQPKQGRYKESEREHHSKNVEAPINWWANQWYIPYIAKRDDTKGRSDDDFPRPKFRTSYSWFDISTGWNFTPV